MKIRITAFILLFPFCAFAHDTPPSPAPAPPPAAVNPFSGPDTWTGEDKALHLMGGMLVGGAVTVWTEKPLWGFAAGCTAGFLKEVADRSSSGFSSKDFIVTCLGAGLGTAYGNWLITRDIGGATKVSFYREF